MKDAPGLPQESLVPEPPLSGSSRGDSPTPPGDQAVGNAKVLAGGTATRDGQVQLEKQEPVVGAEGSEKLKTSKEVENVGGKSDDHKENIEVKFETSFLGNEKLHQHATTNRDEHWKPSIYEEAREMLMASTLIYCLAQARAAVRHGKLAKPEFVEALLDLPLDMDKEVVPVILKNNDMIRKESHDKAAHDTYIQVLQEACTPTNNNGNGKEEVENGKEEGGKQTNTNNNTHSDIMVLDFHDESDKEMVYAVVLNHPRKVIGVVFRGTVTPRDAMADLDPHMGFYPNPVATAVAGKDKSIQKQDEKIGVHLGFATYLNQSTKELGVGKCKDIRERVLELAHQYPTYHIYVTGHSLGASLALLVAFDFATTEEMPKHISCVGVASPKTGNLSFRHAIQALEQSGNLRYLRVTNRHDVIPTMPVQAFDCWMMDLCYCFGHCIPILNQRLRYWTAGVNIVLLEEGTSVISYHRQMLTYSAQQKHERKTQLKDGQGWSKFFRVMSCWATRKPKETLKFHSSFEYMRRLDAARDELHSRYLNDFYAHKKHNRQSVFTPLSTEK